MVSHEAETGVKVSVSGKIRGDNLIEHIKWMGEDKYPKVTFYHYSTRRRTKADHVKEGNKAATGKKTTKDLKE
jgi:predicted metal-dependent RNase